MLEIIMLIGFSRMLAKMAAEKGRTKLWAGLGVGFWIGGEIFGFILGGLLGLGTLPGYGIALVLAACGAGVAFLIVKSLPEEQGYSNVG